MTSEVTNPHTETDNSNNKSQGNPKKLVSILVSGAAGMVSVLYFGPMAVLEGMTTIFAIAIAILTPLALVMIAAIVSGYEEALEKKGERPVQLMATIVGWILAPAMAGAMVTQFAFLALFASSLP